LVKYTSWINRTFGTTFDLAHRTDLLHVYRVLQEEKWMNPKNIDCIEDFLVDCKISSIGALMDAYIETHSVLETLRFFKSRYSRNPWIINAGRWMYQLTHAFVQKRRTSSQSVDEQIREALSYRNWQEQHPYVEPPSNLKPFVYSAILPVNTVFHLIAYAYPSLSYEEARTRYGTYLTGCPPFLSRKASDPDTWEAIQKAKCSLKDIVLCDSDDDRIYWWRKDGDFDLSKGCRTWLDDLRSEHRAICKEMAASSISYHEHLKTLFDTLFYINSSLQLQATSFE
ncbi:MAG: hypothetical protein VZR28_10695, partial [Candidatus Cryptobacteroides sp.]|nr:hypothetical protein [Candidatus Cryptobacteroides sp.]